MKLIFHSFHAEENFMTTAIVIAIIVTAIYPPIVL